MNVRWLGPIACDMTPGHVGSRSFEHNRAICAGCDRSRIAGSNIKCREQKRGGEVNALQAVTACAGTFFDWFNGRLMTPSPRHVAAATLLSVLLLVPSASALAYPLEQVPWQFETSADKANKAVITDMIQRKKNGYYDGFDTTINSTYDYTTKIGTQFNCYNAANAIGNRTQNSQVGNAPDVGNASSVDSSASGNQADNAVQSDNAPNGQGGSDVDSDQDNSGTVDADVTDSGSSATSGPINGSSQQDMDNRQSNSGKQVASIENSTPCRINGSTLDGSAMGTDPTGPLN